MKSKPNERLIGRYTAQGCGLVATLIGAVALTGWFVGSQTLTSFGSQLIAMAPNTAMSFAISGLALFLLTFSPKWILHVARIVVSFVVLLAALRLAEIFSVVNIGVDYWIIPPPGEHLGFAPGRMSTFAALGFLLTSSALLLTALAHKREFLDEIAGTLATMASSIGMAFCLGYAFGTPLFSLGTTIPMALNTAIAFVILGSGILLTLMAHESQDQQGLEKRGRPSIDRKILGGFSLALAFVIIISIIRYSLTVKLIESGRSVAHTHEVLTELEATLSTMKDLQTGARGYAITGNESFLEPYESGRAHIAEQITHLGALTYDNVHQQQLIDVLEPIISEQIGHYAHIIVLQKEKGIEAARELISTGKGQMTMDKIRSVVHAMEEEENGLLKIRDQERESSVNKTIVTFSGLVLVVLLILSITYVAIRRDITGRRMADEALRHAKNLLETRVRERTAELAQSNESMVAEITERKQVEEALRQSEKRYRSLFENMLSGYAHCKILLDHDKPQDFMYVDVNHAFEQFTGLNNVVGKWVTEVIPGIKESNPELFEIYGRVAMGGKPEGFETYVKPLGIWFSVAVYSPKREYFVAVFDNITERKRAEQELRDSENRYRTTLDHMMEGCQIIGFDWRYLYVNDVAASQARRGKDELLGHTMMEMYPGIETAPFFVQLRRCIEERIPQRMENEFTYPDGAKGWFNLSMEPVPEGAFILSEDITEEKKLNEELQKHRKHLEELVKERTAQLEIANKELEAFSYSVSHDLRAPLRHINGFAELLTKHAAGALDEKGDRFLKTISESAKQMGVLIDELLVFSRMGRAEMRNTKINLHQIVQDTLHDLQNECNGRVIEWRIDTLPHVSGDPSMLRLVFANLLSNSIKYTRTRECAQIEVGHGVRDGEIVVFVRDNGVGFDMKYENKLFGVFQRLHRAEDFEGTGIGLANVRRIIQRHGGKTWAEGAIDKGATFYFSLPTEGDPATTSHEVHPQ